MSASSASSAGSPTGGITRKIIQRVIYGFVTLVALLLLLTVVLVHHFTYDECVNIAGRQTKVPAGYHVEEGGVCVINPTHPPPVFIARSGEGWATQASPVRAWLDPMRSTTHLTGGKAWYKAEGHTSPSGKMELKFLDEPGVNSFEKWKHFPAGWYQIYPDEGVEEVFFKWSWN